MSEVHKILRIAKDAKPSYARRDHFPEVIWIEPPVHKNFEDNIRRQKLGLAITNTVKLYSEMRSLQMRKIWDYQDNNLVVRNMSRVTAEGYTKYWLSIDGLVKLWDTYLLAKKIKKTTTTTLAQKKTAVLNPNKPKVASKVLKAAGAKMVKNEVSRNFPFQDRFHWCNKPKNDRKLPEPPARKKLKFD